MLLTSRTSINFVLILLFSHFSEKCFLIKVFWSLYLSMFKSLKLTKYNAKFIRTFSTNNSSHYDICIVGGGLVGFSFASLAGSLPALNSKKILLLESQKQKPFKFHDQFSNRTVALSPNSRAILEDCGAWKMLENYRYRAVKKMFVWEQSSDSFITFEQDNIFSDLAYIVENDLLQHVITSTLSDKPCVEVRYNTHVSNIDFGPCDATVHLADGSTVHAALIIGADGYKSLIRKFAAINTTERELDQKAVVSVIQFDSPMDNKTAWQRFTRHGPIGYLPLDNRHSNVIWSTTCTEADRLMTLDDDAFVTALNREMFTDEHHKAYLGATERFIDQLLHRLPSAIVGLSDGWKHRQLPPQAAAVVAGSRATFPLGFMHATNYVSKNVALIGDAAHRILPLAGQGVNLGFGDVACLVKCLAGAVTEGQPINYYARLQQYETERQRHVLPVAATVQTLHELYVKDFLPAEFLRLLGLRVVNAIHPLKNVFLRGATSGSIL